jgi:hypothetical protein
MRRVENASPTAIDASPTDNFSDRTDWPHTMAAAPSSTFFLHPDMIHTSTITPQQALLRTIEHREIFHDEMLHVVRQIMNGEWSPLMIAALITGLRVKKETIGEITAAAQVMREFSTKVEVADKTHLVDIVGTGGDGSHTFNISTCAMFVAAAAGPRSANMAAAVSAARAAAPT